MSTNNTANTSSIVSKVWAFCNTLRDDGVGSRRFGTSYGDYLEQLTYLLFLKMADGTAGRHITVKCPSPQNTIVKRLPIKAVMCQCTKMV